MSDPGPGNGTSKTMRSRAALARELQAAGCTAPCGEKTLQRLSLELPRNEDGTYTVAIVRTWLETRAEEAELAADVDEDASTLTKHWDMRWRRAKARSAERELERIKGDWIPRDSWDKAMTDNGRAVALGAGQLRQRLVAQLGAFGNNPREIDGIVEPLVTEFLDRLSSACEPARRLGRKGRGGPRKKGRSR